MDAMSDSYLDDVPQKDSRKKSSQVLLGKRRLTCFNASQVSFQQKIKLTE